MSNWKIRGAVAAAILPFGLLASCGAGIGGDRAAKAGTVTVACAKREVVAAWLKRRYGETPRVVGIVNGGNVMELFVSPSGTFTVVQTLPSGVACPAGFGQGLEVLPPPEPTGERS